MAYEDFDLKGDCGTEENYLSPFELTLSTWRTMCSRYRKQDVKANRDISDNVSARDYETYFPIFRGKCDRCGKRFTDFLPPTLGRINCKKAHNNNNVGACCELCNKSRGDGDMEEDMLQFKLR
ncbi:hypothetical protein FACS189472_13540 [Alphaproteobacteria bacterium]|nr:hypothetical protein FACS189472_13540 [Alphaproteobacteria bacterium]